MGEAGLTTMTKVNSGFRIGRWLAKKRLLFRYLVAVGSGRQGPRLTRPSTRTVLQLMRDWRGQRGVDAGAGPAMTATVGRHRRTLKKPDYFLR